jgi:hypothetical protein
VAYITKECLAMTRMGIPVSFHKGGVAKCSVEMCS